MTNLAIFDLDHTLIGCDSCDGWIAHLCANDYISDEVNFQKTQKHYEYQYKIGEINMAEYYAFLLSHVKHIPNEEIQNTVQDYISSHVSKYIYKEGLDILNKHIDANDTILLVSATIEDLVVPIGKQIGFHDQNIIAVNTEKSDKYLTGNTIGELSFSQGKIIRVNQWIELNKLVFDKTYFYSDSINDLPLLEKVDVPVAVNACNKLRVIAKERSWKLMDFQL
jgi:HAD superfamily hydrolase (TIGR01490 family)